VRDRIAEQLDLEMPVGGYQCFEKFRCVVFHMYPYLCGSAVVTDRRRILCDFVIDRVVFLQADA
jgi:hypothetical protein